MSAKILRYFSYLSFVLLLLAPNALSTAWAQSLDPLAPENLAIIEQNGLGNQATIEQQAEAIIGSKNEALQMQLGIGNTATITQRGGNNYAEQNQIGDNNTLELHQNGQGHSAIQNQIGNNLTHKLEQFGPAGPPVIITQEQF